MYDDSDWLEPLWTRLERSGSPDTTPTELSVLAADEDAEVRRRVACHLATPKPALSILAADTDFYVRRAVACNYNAPQDVLATLTEDAHYAVRQEVPWNPSCPLSIKIWLKNGYGQMTLQEFLNAVDSKG